jgi:hypothetical protein
MRKNGSKEPALDFHILFISISFSFPFPLIVVPKSRDYGTTSLEKSITPFPAIVAEIRYKDTHIWIRSFIHSRTDKSDKFMASFMYHKAANYKLKKKGICIFFLTDSWQHPEELVNPKVRAKKRVTDFGYPRACRFRKHQIENRSPDLPVPSFFKTWFKFIKSGKNLEKMTDFQKKSSSIFMFLGRGTH